MTQPILEIRHLRTLAALRDTGSLVRAAQLLNLTQSALSHQIKAVEAHYGCALFERKSLPPQFTASGLRLLQLADSVLPQMETADRDVARLVSSGGGQLRIAVECHTCFDWLMPAMDAFRQAWPEIELDIVSGFHPDPVALLLQDKAEVAIVAEQDAAEPVDHHALFRFEIVALMANGHALAEKPYLTAEDFADQTLITYPVPDEMLDVLRQVMQPAGLQPRQRRTTELTVAMLQLVASGRGIAALPWWAVQTYLERGYVSACPIGPDRLRGELHMACRPGLSAQAWLSDFVRITRDSCFKRLPGIELL